MTEPKECIARLEGVSKTYVMGTNKVEALKDVDLTFNKGEFWAIMGPSGSGKSTLLNLLGCLDRPTTGSYELGGNDVANMKDEELSSVRGEMLGFVFQSFNLIPQLDILENIEVPLFYQGMPPKQSHAKAMELARRVGLQDRANHRPWELSGGQQQRVAIARALVNDPILVLADEPTGNLDSTTGEEIMNILCELHAQGGTIIMVTHEDEIASYAQKVLTMHDGKVASIKVNQTQKTKGTSI